ncbi:MAG: integrin alpha, partial [Pseudomonadota bacterium]
MRAKSFGQFIRLRRRRVLAIPLKLVSKVLFPKGGDRQLETSVSRTEVYSLRCVGYVLGATALFSRSALQPNNLAKIILRGVLASKLLEPLSKISSAPFVDMQAATSLSFAKKSSVHLRGYTTGFFARFPQVAEHLVNPATKLFLRTVLLFSALFFCNQVSADPETWFDPTISIEGSLSSARFGSSLSCSHYKIGGAASLIAIGAPDENSGEGAVYIFDPDSPTIHRQRIVSDNPGPAKRFGASVAFIEDFNGDFIDELVVTEPNVGGANSSTRVYISTGATPPYSLCGTYNELSGWGHRVVRVLDDGLSDDSYVALSTPSGGRVKIISITPPAMLPTCGIAEYTSRVFGSGAGTQAGFSLGEAYGTIFVGAPGVGSNSGEVFLYNPASFRVGTSAERMGLGVAADPTNSIVAMAAGGSQTVYVTSEAKNLEPNPN